MHGTTNHEKNEHGDHDCRANPSPI